MPEQLTFLPSLDFPDGSILRLDQIAGKLGCSVQHLLNEIEHGAFVGLDLRNKDVTRRAVRIPVECYRNYVFSKFTGSVDARMDFLRDLPLTTRIDLIAALKASLKPAA